MRVRTLLVLAALHLCFYQAQAAATEQSAIVRIAVAANFKTTLLTLLDQFKADYPAYRATSFLVSGGSTGSLYTQIVNGAPYQLFLAADTDHTDRLVAQGFGDPDTNRAYAIGLPVVTIKLDAKIAQTANCTNPDSILALAHSTLTTYGEIIIANPRTAPYGRAGMKFVERLPNSDKLTVVRARNVVHAQQLFANTAVRVAILAKAQIIDWPGGLPKNIIACEVSGASNEILTQSALRLNPNTQTAAAIKASSAFLAFLDQQRAKQIILANGFALPGSTTGAH